MDKSIDDIYSDHKFFGVIITESKKLDDIYKSSLHNIIQTLNSNNIVLSKIYKISLILFELIPSLRSICWKLLLGYIPLDNKEWESSIDEKRQKYYDLQTKYLAKIKKEKIKKYDHPLNNEKDSKWMDYFQENKLGSVIEKDLKRTRNEISFRNKL